MPIAGMPIPKIRAKAIRPVLLAPYQRTSGRKGYARAPLLGAVVEMLRVAVAAEPLTVTALGLKLNVGRSCAPAGLEVTAAVSVTLPVKPPIGVTIIVEVLPAVAPGLTDTAVPLTVKPGVCAAVTVRPTAAVAIKLPDVPVMVTVADPVSAEPLAVRVKVLVVEVLVGLKDAVTPLGSPEAAKLTLPVKPPEGLTVIVLVPSLPCAMLKLLGAAESTKLGTAVTVTKAVPVPVV